MQNAGRFGYRFGCDPLTALGGTAHTGTLIGWLIRLAALKAVDDALAAENKNDT